METSSAEDSSFVVEKKVRRKASYPTVSSKGAARGFVAHFLWRTLIHVTREASENTPIGFPFSTELTKELIAQAKLDTVEETFSHEFGGSDFDASESSSFWSDTRQFGVWWKNNVERKAKVATLTNDSLYSGPEEKLIKRANFCKLVVLFA